VASVFASLARVRTVIRDRQPEREFIRRSSLNSAGIAIARVLGFGFSFVLAKAYAASEYGHVVYVLMLASLLSVLVQPFGQHVMAYYIGKHSSDPQHLKRLMGNAWVVWAALVALTLTLAIPVLLATSRFSAGVLVVFLGTSVFYTYYGIASGFLASTRLLAVYLASNVLQIILVCIVAFVLRVESVTPALFIYGLAYVIPLVAVTKLAPLPVSLRFQLDRPIAREIVRFSVPIWLSQLLYLGYSSVDVLLLEHFTDSGEVGVYGLTKTITTAFHFLPMGIQIFLMPKIAGSARVEHNRLLGQSLALVAAANVAGGALYLLVYPWFIKRIIGPDYYVGMLFGGLMALAAMLYAFHTLITAALVGSGRASLETTSRAIMMALMVGLGAALIPTHGALGTAITSLAAVAGGLLFYCFVWIAPTRLLQLSEVSGRVFRAADPRPAASQWLLALRRRTSTEKDQTEGSIMSDVKKALIVVENSAPPADLRVWYEATTLRDAGWQVFVICPASHPDQPAGVPEDLEGVTLYRFHLEKADCGLFCYVREYIVAFFSIARLCHQLWKRERFDLIHFCNPPDLFFPLMWCARLRGVRVVFDHHDLFPEFIATRFPNLFGRALSRVARLCEFFSMRSAHVVLSTNESYRRIAVERGKVSSQRAIVVRNGPRHEFRPQEPSPDLKAGFPYLVCFAGVMGQEDGLLNLVDSIEYIVRKAGRRDIRFALLGDGATRLQAIARIQESDYHNQVYLPGMLTDRDELRRYLATADVCVSPEPPNHLNNVSTFIKVGEYMAMGKPVVAFSLPETRTTAGEAAVYVPPGDADAFGQAIIDLIDDPAKRETMGQYARERVVNVLGWEHQSKHFLNAYDLALRKNGARPITGPSEIETYPCQLLGLPAISESTVGLRMPLLFHLKLMVKRRMTPKQRVMWKNRMRKVGALLTLRRPRTGRRRLIPAPTAGATKYIPGDVVQIKDVEAIKSTLDLDARLRGCSFMPEMERFCGTTHRVLKPVERFLDERDYRVKKTSGILLLEGVMCEGTAEFGPCDRSCFFFWRQEWVERVEQAPMDSDESGARDAISPSTQAVRHGGES